jgi:hypothetical protein
MRLVFLALLLSLAPLATGCMWGVVRDINTGAPISGAQVSYTDSQGRSATTTTDANGVYAFDWASGPIPAIGPISATINAPGYQTLMEPRQVAYDDNPNATLSNLSSYWEAQHFFLAPGGVPPAPPTPTPTQPPSPPVITPLPVLTADLALTDVYPDFLPVGSLYIRITNNGPHSVQGIAVDLNCFLWWWNPSTALTTSQWINPGVVIYLDPGQTVAVPMNAQVHADQYQYVAGCDLGVPLGIDPDLSNNSYSENIP